MPHRAFFAFILPSLVAMILFIALPIVSVVVQSFYIQHERVVSEVETCSPFGGCTKEMRVDAAATERLREEEPLGRFNGFGTYIDRNHLAFSEVGAILSDNNGLRDIIARVYNLPFYKALSFTLAYTFIVTPLAMLLGFAIALGVNAIPPFYKGPIIFFSLLPMIVTPLVGALIIYWMVSSQGHHRSDPAIDLQRPHPIPEIIGGADLDYHDRLRHLAQRPILLRRILRRLADGAAGYGRVLRWSTARAAGSESASSSSRI